MDGMISFRFPFDVFVSKQKTEKSICAAKLVTADARRRMGDVFALPKVLVYFERKGMEEKLLIIDRRCRFFVHTLAIDEQLSVPTKTEKRRLRSDADERTAKNQLAAHSPLGRRRTHCKNAH